MPLRPRRLRIFVVASTLLLLVTALATLILSDSGQRAFAEASSRSPQSLIRYIFRRLEGHPNLERLMLGSLRAAQRHFERTPPPGPLPTLGKGQQASLAPQRAGQEKLVRAASEEAIAQALLRTEPGTRIVIAPGHYRFNQTLRLGHDGRVKAPIALSALVPGTVRLDFSQDEGILVDRPYWIFENLDIHGMCEPADACEHAFHVVGAAAFTILRNNHVQDFNAHIKVNGLNGKWPDHGLAAFNTLTNRAPRVTEKPVVMFDLVGAHQWRLEDNLVTNFAKRGGHGVAYGLYMKGASEGGRIERNLVVCSPTDISEPGERVGISFGGGRTGPGVCRGDGCRAFEHRLGLAANNIVAHCNDAGMDLNGAHRITLAYNTLINTAGFSIRGNSQEVYLVANLYEGRMSVRKSAPPKSEMNLKMDPLKLFTDPEALLFQWAELPESIPSRLFVTNDFRGAERHSPTLPGALERNLQ